MTLDAVIVYGMVWSIVCVVVGWALYHVAAGSKSDATMLRQHRMVVDALLQQSRDIAAMNLASTDETAGRCFVQGAANVAAIQAESGFAPEARESDLDAAQRAAETAGGYNDPASQPVDTIIGPPSGLLNPTELARELGIVDAGELEED